MIRNRTIAEKWKVCECRLSVIKSRGERRGREGERELAVQTSHCEGYEQPLFSPQLRAVWSANVWLLLWGLCLCVCISGMHVCVGVCLCLCVLLRARQRVHRQRKKMYIRAGDYIIFKRVTLYMCVHLNVSTQQIHCFLSAPVSLNKCGMGSQAGTRVCARFFIR